MKVVILGDGLLGKELHKQTNWHFISRKTHENMDFADETSYLGYLKDFDVIINCIAHTDTYSKKKFIGMLTIRRLVGYAITAMITIKN